jgi:3-hydroxymyristoyl/3-hydroxydecanoyl-(acyl carrier protein) dehydratase
MIDVEKELQGSYQIRSREKDLLEVEVQPSVRWTYFNGHFPHAPILPAVAIIDVSQFFIEELWGVPSALSRMKSFRIRNPVQPGDKIQIRVQQESPGSFHVLWKSSENDKIFADISLQVAEYSAH